MSSFLPKFSHLYIEKEAQGLNRTQEIIARFKKSEIVLIDSYKEILNRNKQNWTHQKKSPKLVLAVKRDGFLYPGSEVTPSFGFEHFYYNSLLLNCLYDCQYCYLQGMFPSAHMVAFVNLDDFFKATSEVIQKKKPLYLCISYDTDLLALEGIFSYSKEWIEFARKNSDLHIELRTKSVNTKILEESLPCKNVTLAWTLNPQVVIDQYELNTPSLQARIQAVRKCVQMGWKVRVCFDPVIRIADWQKFYLEAIAELTKQVSDCQISEFSIGSFRMNRQYFSRINENHTSDLFHKPYQMKNGVVQYSDDERKEISSFMKSTLVNCFPKTPLHLWL